MRYAQYTRALHQSAGLPFFGFHLPFAAVAGAAVGAAAGWASSIILPTAVAYIAAGIGAVAGGLFGWLFRWKGRGALPSILAAASHLTRPAAGHVAGRRSRPGSTARIAGQPIPIRERTAR